LAGHLRIRNRGRILIDSPVRELRDIWEGALEQMLHDTVMV